LRFIDEAIITVRAGSGGAGSASFYRGAFVPKGGPDGGDGGRGGDIILRASPNIATLADVALKSLYQASDGKPGQGNQKSGRAGRDIIIQIPIGTVVYDADSQEIAADLVEMDQSVIVAKGGRGGRGNVHFASSRNRTPRFAEAGRPGEKKRLRLELKLIADVGLVGRPNAGKSTLLKALTRAAPKIGDFPFTTLTPNLGVVPVGEYSRFTIADLPGLIEGARFGRGLGHRFLRHIERTNLIVVLIETSEPNYVQTYASLMSELQGYSEDLVQLPRLVVRSKADIPQAVGSDDFNFDLAVSAFSSNGLQDLVKMIAEKLRISNISI